VAIELDQTASKPLAKGECAGGYGRGETARETERRVLAAPELNENRSKTDQEVWDMVA
jgi:hypothetical protein